MSEASKKLAEQEAETKALQAKLDELENNFYEDYVRQDDEREPPEYEGPMEADYAVLEARRRDLKKARAEEAKLRKDAEREKAQIRLNQHKAESGKLRGDAIHFVRSKAAWGATAVLAGIFSLAVSGHLASSALPEARWASTMAGAALLVAAIASLSEARLHAIVEHLASSTAAPADVREDQALANQRLIRHVPHFAVAMELLLSIAAGAFMLSVVLAAGS